MSYMLINRGDNGYSLSVEDENGGRFVIGPKTSIEAYCDTTYNANTLYYPSLLLPSQTTSF